MAARLLLVHGSTIEHALSPQIQLFVDALRTMGRYWLVAQRYTAILERVLDEHRDSEHAAAANGQRVLPSSVKILADMRRTAYDLDFLISRQPKYVGISRVPSVTPARTPAPNELEYLDVFDFFNVPRLPVVAAGDVAGVATPGLADRAGVGNAEGRGVGNEGGSRGGGADGLADMRAADVQPGANEFNITNFMVDANSDWLFKNHS